jgi:uncharacterized membrane protein YebE (DUF533 family)
MNTKGLLDQLLKSGQSLMQNHPSSRSSTYRSTPSSGFGNQISGLGKGALGGTALSMLLGSKRMRTLGGKGLAYGGLAGLGMLAYRAYSDWQKQNAVSAPAEAPRTVDRLTGEEAQSHSDAILKALVAAAKADGHIDERERQLIEAEMDKLSGDTALRRWLEAELSKPIDPAEVASAATSLEVASEMYLVSLLMIDDKNYMERAYLDELARNLKLEPSLKASLEAQALRAQDSPA